MSKLRTEHIVAQINARDLMHRKGWRFSERITTADIVDHLMDEARELKEAVVENTSSGKDPHVKEEAADVLACLLQAIYREGYSFAEIEAEAERKLRLRFHGAADIVVPEEDGLFVV